MRGGTALAGDETGTDVLGRRFRADGETWRVEALARSRSGPVALLLSVDARRPREVPLASLRAGGRYEPVRGDAADAGD